MTSTVLLADDDRAIRESLVRAMELEGCRVIPVPDGVQAPSAVRRGAVHAAVVDVMMPGVDGLDVCACCALAERVATRARRRSGREVLVDAKGVVPARRRGRDRVHPVNPQPNLPRQATVNGVWTGTPVGEHHSATRWVGRPAITVTR